MEPLYRSKVTDGPEQTLLAGGTGTLLARSWSPHTDQPSHLAARATATALSTATATATATPLPAPTATPKPRPTATPKPKPKPSGPVNYLVVRIGGCGSFPYPTLFFTNTDPGKFDDLFWYEAAWSTNHFYLFGDEGAKIPSQHTEQVEVLPDTAPAEGPITFTVKADRELDNVDYGPAGYWHGTIYPCQ